VGGGRGFEPAATSLTSQTGPERAALRHLEKAMPEIELCTVCNQRINRETENYVVISRSQGAQPEIIAHEKCAQKK